LFFTFVSGSIGWLAEEAETDLNESFEQQFLAGQGMLKIPVTWCQTNLSKTY